MKILPARIGPTVCELLGPTDVYCVSEIIIGRYEKRVVFHIDIIGT